MSILKKAGGPEGPPVSLVKQRAILSIHLVSIRPFLPTLKKSAVKLKLGGKRKGSPTQSKSQRRLRRSKVTTPPRSMMPAMAGSGIRATSPSMMSRGLLSKSEAPSFDQ